MQNKRIVLGVTGSIAVFKAAYLASQLTQAGVEVDVIMTDAATRFVSPLTFQSLTGRHCYTNRDLWEAETHIPHVGLARGADLLIIAPATANTLAKLAHGLSDDLLGLTVLSSGPRDSRPHLVLAPSMDGDMWRHSATQANVDQLRATGAIIIGPEEGHLASGLIARGRMTEPVELIGHIRLILSRGGPLSGCRVVVTAGGTREPIDPVRAITNRSSGKQGLALAQAALDQGADVTFISPALSLALPIGLHQVTVETAFEMKEAVLEACQQAHVLLMAAAVSDFRPSEVAAQKIKKGAAAPTIYLQKNPDILQEVYRWRQETGKKLLVVGFAAETENLLANASSKLQQKGLALIVANDVSAVDAGFSVDTNRVLLLDEAGDRQQLPLLTKQEVASHVIEAVKIKLGIPRPSNL